MRNGNIEYRWALGFPYNLYVYLMGSQRILLISDKYSSM